MPVLTQERFDSGETYAQVRARVESNGGRILAGFEAAERATAVAEIDLSSFTSLDTPVKVLVISEDWCGDCHDNLPILNRIAEETGKVDLRIFARDENLDLADQFLKEGKYRSIPVIVVLDENLEAVNHLIERPSTVTALRQKKRQELHEAHPELGGFATAPDQLSDEVRDARGKAESALKAETAPWAVSEVVNWVGSALSPAAVATA
ncbi:thioredoxin family protein [soil metagenome]